MKNVQIIDESGVAPDSVARSTWAYVILILLDLTLSVEYLNPRLEANPAQGKFQQRLGPGDVKEP